MRSNMCIMGKKKQKNNRDDTYESKSRKSMEVGME